jgi:hypothetical protein
MAKIPRKSGSSDGLTVATQRVEPVLFHHKQIDESFSSHHPQLCAGEQKGLNAQENAVSRQIGR